MSSSRFSIQTVLLYTAAFAAGFSVWRASDGGAFDFCLGALTVFIAGGLVQQIVPPRRCSIQNRVASTSRRLCLALVLGCLCLAMFRAHVPYTVMTMNEDGLLREEAFESTVAAPLWIFTLVLGSLTARGMLLVSQSTSAPKRVLRYVTTALVTSAILAYLVYIVAEWTFIPVLVDIAIQGVKLGLSQGPSVDTPHFVEWFGRSPQQFDDYVSRQAWSWLSLLLGLFVAIALSQASSVRKRWACLWVGVSCTLAIPAVANLYWLTTGGARTMFPELVDSYWSEPRPELAMTLPLLLLVALYLTTRRVHGETDCDHAEPRVLWCDRSIVGWLFILMGLFGTVRVIQDFYVADWLLDTPAWEPGWFDVAAVIPGFVVEITSYPTYTYEVFLAPFGACWLLQRRRSGDGRGERWPQLGTHQIVCFPLITLLLATSVILSIPFGMAVRHIGL